MLGVSIAQGLGLASFLSGGGGAGADFLRGSGTGNRLRRRGIGRAVFGGSDGVSSIDMPSGNTRFGLLGLSAPISISEALSAMDMMREGVKALEESIAVVGESAREGKWPKESLQSSNLRREPPRRMLAPFRGATSPARSCGR